MRLIYRLVFIFIMALLVLSCDTERDKAQFSRLAQLDSLLDTSPEKTKDSLQKINPKDLSRYNYGYYLLLDVIAKDKKYYNFISDSLIQTSLERLDNSKNEYPDNYARALIYSGIVRNRMGINDSTAYQPLKDAANFMEKNKNNNQRNLYFCYHYLGMIHNSNGNMDLSVLYYEKAITAAKKLKNKDYLFKSYLELAWDYLKMEKANITKIYIDTLYQLSKNNYEKKDLDYLSASYYERINENKQALTINLRLLKDINNAQPLHKAYYRISKNYLHLHQADSALHYAEMAQKNIQDTSFYLNYFYYGNIGKIAGDLNLWQKSALAYKKAYELRDKAVEKDLDKKIMELEKKYDLTLSENKALKYRNRTTLFGAFSVLLFVLLISGWLVWKNYKKQAAIKIQLAKQQNLVLEQQNKQIEQNLFEKKFILPLYQRISQRNAKVTALLSDLTTNTHIVKNPELTKIITHAYQEFIQAADIRMENFLSDEDFIKFTGLDNSVCCKFNNSEKMLLSFIALQLDNKQIAVLFNTSESGIRGRKTKLRAKLQQFNIEMENLL